MARIHELLRQLRLTNSALADDIEREVDVLGARRAFGLNFERHSPEAVELPGRPVRTGDKVHVLPARGETPTAANAKLWRVISIEGQRDNRIANLELHPRVEPTELSTVAVTDLVVVAEFRDPIYPGLVSTGRVERGGDKPFNTVINGENYHALQTLLFAHRGKVDAIYIDPPYNTGAKDWTTSHYSSRIAHQRSRDAQERGASLVMLMAPFFGATIRVDERHVLEYFKRVADGLDVDIMIQDAPMSPTTMSVELLARLAAEVPQVRYAKIEVPRTSYKVRELVAAAAESLPGIFDGEEAITLIPDLNAGVKGTMSSCVVPDQLGRIVREFQAGNIQKATAEWEKVLPLIHYENRHCGLNAAKYLMKAGGVIGSDRTRAPFPALPAFVERELLELAQRQEAFVLRWAR